MTYRKIAVALLFSLAVLLGGCLGYEEYAAVEPPTLTLDDDFEIFGSNPSDWGVGDTSGGNPSDWEVRDAGGGNPSDWEVRDTGGGNPSDWGVEDAVCGDCRYFNTPSTPGSATDEDIRDVKSHIRTAKNKLDELEKRNESGRPSGERGREEP
jgi:hypothetical protein